MSLILETVQTEGIAELSYLIGDDKTGTAAVIDPRSDVEIYLELAKKRKVSITHIFETHIHADLVSGSRELAERVKTAKICVSVEGRAKYDFTHEALKDGATFEFGDLVLTARHTPGHTPEHMSYVHRPEHDHRIATRGTQFVRAPAITNSGSTQHKAIHH